MRVNLVQESARHLQMTRARQMRVDTRDLPEAIAFMFTFRKNGVAKNMESLKRENEVKVRERMKKFRLQ